jgi:hypothetical protein
MCVVILTQDVKYVHVCFQSFWESQQYDISSVQKYAIAIVIHIKQSDLSQNPIYRANPAEL